MDRVEGCALAEVVRDHPHLDATWITDVFADAADVHRVPTRGVDRLRVDSIAQIVDDLDALGPAQELAGAFRREGLMSLDRDGLAMGRDHRHTNRRR